MMLPMLIGLDPTRGKIVKSLRAVILDILLAPQPLLSFCQHAMAWLTRQTAPMAFHRFLLLCNSCIIAPLAIVVDLDLGLADLQLFLMASILFQPCTAEGFLIKAARVVGARLIDLQVVSLDLPASLLVKATVSVLTLIQYRRARHHRTMARSSVPEVAALASFVKVMGICTIFV